MQIFVKTLTGKTVTLQVEDSTLVMDIKTQIEEKEGIPIYRQTLYNGNKILEQDQNSLSSYNVFNEATLQMTLRWNGPVIEVESNQSIEVENNQSIKRNQNGKRSLTEKKDASDEFEDKLVKSMTLEMNREIEEKRVAFKKLEEDRIQINLKVSELEDKRVRNERQFNRRNSIKYKYRSDLQLEKVQALEEKQITDQKIVLLQRKSENLECLIKNKEARMKNIFQEQVQDTIRTEKESKKLEQEISTLKRKRVDIEREENGLLNKKKVNDGLVEFISRMKDLECPVCFETAQVPIFRCERDHLICNKCLPKLDICPECRKHYPKSPVRNRYAEKQVEEIQKLSAKRKTILDGV